MPISLPPISRRRFLATSIAGGAVLLSGRDVLADERSSDPNRFALLADTHVSGKADEVVRGVTMSDNLRRVGQQVLASQPQPAAILINGDCAYLAGTAEDYVVLVELLQPLRRAELSVHLALGNHDHRERFWEALTTRNEDPKVMDSRHLTVLETPHANWFILDSLDVTNRTPGLLGPEQLDWLARGLDASEQKPALVMLHHNPDQRPMTSGLVDTDKLLAVLQPRRQVKAVFFGHTHNWQLSEQDGIHLINLPPVAYVFAEGKPNGWVDMLVQDQGAQLELRCLDPEHAEHGKQHHLQWRL